MRNLFFINVLTICFCFWCCENEESLIGNNLLNSGEHILENHIHNFNITTQIELDDSVSASGQTSLLGSYVDPIFGQVDASFCFQIQIPVNEYNPQAVSINNIYLTIPYNGFYGDTSVVKDEISFDIDIAQLNTNISELTDIYSSEDLFPSIPITTIAKNLIEIETEGSLILNLTESQFGFDEILNLNQNQFINDSSFVEAFNGFQLTVSQVNTGGVLYLDSYNDEASLTIEYTNSTNENDTVQFKIGPQTKFNHFSQNQKPELVKDSDILLMQSMGGFFSRIKLDNLQTLRDSGYIAVNEAKIIAHIADINGPYPLPESLSLYKDTNSELSSFDFISNANLNTSNNTYEFNITDYLQTALLSSDTVATVRMYTYFTSRNSNADRVVLSNSDNQPIEVSLLLIKQALP